MAERADKTSRRVALVCTNFTMQSAFGLLIVALTFYLRRQE